MVSENWSAITTVRMWLQGTRRLIRPMAVSDFCLSAVSSIQTPLASSESRTVANGCGLSQTHESPYSNWRAGEETSLRHAGSPTFELPQPLHWRLYRSASYCLGISIMGVLPASPEAGSRARDPRFPLP